ncbi:MAG TPA: NrtA/SsuA/CpmA family ABC transporter substrate-binding protein [Acidimicrobiales bacterium]
MLAALLLPLTVAGTLAACGGDSSGAAGAAGSGSGGAGEEFVIRFADPGNHGIVAHGKRHGSFEEALAEVGAAIEWVPAAGSFSANFDLLQAGEINTHQAAVSPIVGAVSNGLDFRIFAISDPVPSGNDGIVATPGSGITSVEDLEGARVAVNPKAHGEWLLLQALTEAGLDPDAVERVPIQAPDAAAAFESGEIDAWATFGPFFVTAVAGGGVPVVTDADYESYDDVGIVGASGEALEAHPEAYEAFVEVYAELTELAHESPEDFVNVFTDSGPEAYEGATYEAAVEENRTAPIPHVPDEEDRERIGRVLQLFIDNGVVEESIDLDDVVVDVTANRGS